MDSPLTVPVALIAAAATLIGMCLRMWVTVRKDEIQFRREMAEALAEQLQELLENLYEILDDDLFTMAKAEATRIRAQAQLIARSFGKSELLIKLYFPDLERYWNLEFPR